MSYSFRDQLAINLQHRAHYLIYLSEKFSAADIKYKFY